jgi:pimeloyl-ACP methyl ester carboxylesterase
MSTLEQRFTVYALDRPGRGASGDHAAYALERELEDIAAVVDGIGGPVDLLGHSMGALVSLAAAPRLANLRRLGLYEPPIPTSTLLAPPSLAVRLDALIAAGEREEAVATFLAEAARLPPEDLAVMKALPAWQARVAAAHTIPRPFRAALELVQAAIPHAELVVLPNQQHAAMDTAPDMFLRELLRFYAG